MFNLEFSPNPMKCSTPKDKINFNIFNDLKQIERGFTWSISGFCSGELDWKKLQKFVLEHCNLLSGVDHISYAEIYSRVVRENILKVNGVIQFSTKHHLSHLQNTSTKNIGWVVWKQHENPDMAVTQLRDYISDRTVKKIKQGKFKKSSSDVKSHQKPPVEFNHLLSYYALQYRIFLGQED